VRDGAVLAPLVAVIVALALYPGVILERGEASVAEVTCRSIDYADTQGEYGFVFTHGRFGPACLTGDPEVAPADVEDPVRLEHYDFPALSGQQASTLQAPHAPLALFAPYSEQKAPSSE
jgi:hypothetical protein